MSCKYCENEMPMMFKNIAWTGFGGEIQGYDEWQVFIDRGCLRLAAPEDCQCMDHGEKIKINYCPMCGVKID